jgi:hypothetical protein
MTQPNRIAPTDKCNARNRFGQPCQRPAGWGTGHPHSGRCKLHGGSTHGAEKAAVTDLSVVMEQPESLYQYRGELAKHFNRMQEIEHNPVDLLPELDTQRVIVGLLLDRLGKMSELDNQAAGDRESEIKSGVASYQDDNVSKDFTLDTVGGGGIGHLVIEDTSVVDPPVEFFQFTGQELIENIRLHVNDISNIVGKIVSMRNQTALTKAEVMYMLVTMKGLIEEFIPDVDRRAAFIKRMREAIPVFGDKAMGGEE